MTSFSKPPKVKKVGDGKFRTLADLHAEEAEAAYQDFQ